MDHEIDDWLNADMLHTPGRGPLQTPLLQLAQAVQAADARVEISHMSLGLREGEAASFLVRPLVDQATGKPVRAGLQHGVRGPGDGCHHRPPRLQEPGPELAQSYALAAPSA